MVAVMKRGDVSPVPRREGAAFCLDLQTSQQAGKSQQATGRETLADGF